MIKFELNGSSDGTGGFLMMLYTTENTYNDAKQLQFSSNSRDSQIIHVNLSQFPADK